MATELAQSILDALTDIEMPKRLPVRAAANVVRCEGVELKVHCAEALVLGSGAAGLRAAVEMKRRGVDVMVATQNLYGGTSACSGSDKQTLHTAAGGGRGDDFNALAKALGAGGAMDEDTAYVEAVGSLPALASLQFMGLPIPLDRYGAALRYKTDHDEAGRATSCGPRTSRLMVKALAEEAARLGAPFVNRAIGAKLLVEDGRAIGLLAFVSGDRSAANPQGLALFLFGALVIAAGGPGELYRDSVYPRHCFGALGLALEAGVEAVNLTESQFGIGTPRDGFPWNLSGTYAQAMPYIYSRDDAGREHNFLADYYRTTQELASNIFRKGYQWPFHASRMLNFASSLVDLAIFRETQAGRTVLMDFNRNPLPVPGDLDFSLERLDDDVKAYLANNDARQATPVERLKRMNPLSIELYRRYKKDITREPLPFAVNNQHMNGGLAVDIWGRTNLPGCYAIGEAAGTHGVTRPGGAALNSGQVFGLRCAQHIHARRRAPADQVPLDALAAAIAETRAAISTDGLDWSAVAREVQARMSDHAGFICKPADVATALSAARALNAQIRQRGVNPGARGEASRATQWRHMALVSEAVLAALDAYLREGGGSRGARAVCDPNGGEAPAARALSLEDYRFRDERPEDRGRKQIVRRAGDGFLCETRPLRRRDPAETAYFERDWGLFLSGALYPE